jgi:hypothetical protein
MEIGPNAGATIAEDTGETNMKSDTRTVVTQRFRTLQFGGFSVSSGESHVTCAMFLFFSKCSGAVCGQFTQYGIR